MACVHSFVPRGGNGRARSVTARKHCHCRPTIASHEDKLLVDGQARARPEQVLWKLGMHQLRYPICPRDNSILITIVFFILFSLLILSHETTSSCFSCVSRSLVSQRYHFIFSGLPSLSSLSRTLACLVDGR
jgi:hypothetical protein